MRKFFISTPEGIILKTLDQVKLFDEYEIEEQVKNLDSYSIHEIDESIRNLPEYRNKTIVVNRWGKVIIQSVL